MTIKVTPACDYDPLQFHATSLVFRMQNNGTTRNPHGTAMHATKSTLPRQHER